MDRRKSGVVRNGIVVPTDSTDLDDGTEVEIVVCPKRESRESYQANHFSLQMILAVTTLACCVAFSPHVSLVLIFVVGGFGIGIACIHGAWTHRPTGWFSGVFFGFLVVLMMAAAILGQWHH